MIGFDWIKIWKKIEKLEEIRKIGKKSENGGGAGRSNKRRRTVCQRKPKSVSAAGPLFVVVVGLWRTAHTAPSPKSQIKTKKQKKRRRGGSE